MRKYLFFGVSLAVLAPSLAAPALAQSVDDVADDGMRVAIGYGPAESQITVTATGTPSEVEDTGQAVTIVQREEIEAVQGADLTRIIERIPGVTFARTGGVGTTTAIRVRGAEAEQLLVMIDGVRVADPSSPNGGYDFGNLLSGNVEKIDLLRGSNSTIWGSDAIGGVMAVTTRNLDGVTASAEYGARDTIAANATGGVSGDWGSVGVTGSYFKTDGFSAAANGTEPDGFEQWSVAGRGKANLSDALSAFAGGSYSKGTLDIDGPVPPTWALGDTLAYQKTRQYTGFAGLTYDDGPLYLKATYSLADTERQNYSSPTATAPGFTGDGHSDRVELRGEWRPIGPLILNFGGDSEWTRFENGSNTAKSRISGAYVQAGIEYGGLSAHLGVRQDDHKVYGGATSFGADISYEVADDIRIRASIGEGFKAPSLYQLHSNYGNTALRPEQSTSFDLGIAWNNRNKPFYAAATIFQRDSEDMIAFASCGDVIGCDITKRPYGTYDNIGKVRAQGLELELGARPSDTFAVQAVYAYVDTENRTDGSPYKGTVLARRPKHALTFSADWETPLAGLKLGGDIRMVSDSFDRAGQAVRLDGYYLMTLRASVPIGEKLELFGRVENITDEQYQTAAGYGTPGRGAFIGARAAF